MFDLKRFRKDKKLKQGDVAEKTQLDRARISHYESGKYSATVEDKLLEVFPELKEYPRPDESEAIDFKIKYFEGEKEIEYLKKLNLVLEEKLADYKRLLLMTEKIIENQSKPKKAEDK